MIAKDLPVPIRLVLTEIVKRRLIPGHYRYPDVERDLARRQAGYWGERLLESYVKELPQNQYYIFHDLQLCIEGVHFQIDTFLLSQYLNLIIEAKNISGTLTFDHVFKQLIRTNPDGTEDIFDDPRVQARCHQILLKRWAAYNGLKLPPLEYLVFFSNVKTKLQIKPGDQSDFTRVCKGRELFLKIDDLEKTFQRKIIDVPKMEEIKELLLKSHNPQKIDILKEYNFTAKDIRPGVCCPFCLFMPMIYSKKQWCCPSCKKISKDAHYRAFEDYSYLYKPTIKNSEVRQFLSIPSPNVTQKLIHSMDLPSTGKTKNRIYFL